MTSKLKGVLQSVDWGKNIESSLAKPEISSALEAAAMRLAVWSKQFEVIDTKNPALCFTREMQILVQQSSALIGLCIYKASAATTRAFVETALYYTFFRTHHDELATLVRKKDYYISKSFVIKFHHEHTPDFAKFEQVTGLVGRLDNWYSIVSAVVHGQMPGAWNNHATLSDIAFHSDTQELAVKAFLDAEAIVNDLFFCTVGQKFWSSFAPDAKAYLIKGMPGSVREQLGLDAK